MNIVSVCAHPDDAEMCMGGILAASKRQGHRIFIVDMTDGEPTPYGSVEKRKKEAETAADILGIEERITLNFTNRYLIDTVEVRRALAEVFREIKPDVIITHYWIDKHPDHIATSGIVDASVFYSQYTKTDMKGEPFRPGRVYYAPACHLLLHFIPSFIFRLSEEDFERKLSSVRAYESQIKFREEMIIRRIETVNRYFGELSNAPYGEPLYCKEVTSIKNFIDIF